jgi:Lon protease-like protein
MTNEERARLFELLKSYFGKKGYQTDWNSVEELPTNLLVNALTGQLPLETRERQALIESISPNERLDKLIHLLEFDVADSNGTLAIRH